MNNTLNNGPTSVLGLQRIDLVDALRGFALMGICLIHCMEYFELYLARRDGGLLHEVMFFLFAGKSYAIFAMMFGLSFFIIMDRQAQKGINFSGRFAWRMLLLALIGYLHTLLYHGDILLVLGVIGLSLLFLQTLSDRWLFILSLLFIIQVPFLYQFVASLNQVASANEVPSHWAMYRELIAAHVNNRSFAEHIWINTTLGIKAKTIYFVESGRGVQLIGLFIWGLLLGRMGFFTRLDDYASLRRKALVWTTLACILLFIAQKYLAALPADIFQSEGRAKWVLDQLLASYLSTAMMALWVLLFMYAYLWHRTYNLLHLLAPCGRVSLSIYLIQAVICVPIFYPWALGWYSNATQASSLLLGVVFYALLIVVAHWWVKRFQYGPAEWLWRCATYMTMKVPFKKP